MYMSDGMMKNTILVVLFLFANYSSSSPSSSSSSHGPRHGGLIESCCSITLYPHICYSTIDRSSSSSSLETKKDVIQLTISKTKDIIQNDLHAINNLIITTRSTSTGTTTKIALHDCFDMLHGTLEALDTARRRLATYNPTNKPYYLIKQQADHLKTLMSTAITNKETCFDGFSSHHNHHFLESVVQPQLDHGGKMCSNVLAMINNMTDTDMINVNQGREERRLKEESRLRWPRWLSARDRKLFWWPVVTPNVTVAKDGHGNYTTVEEAVAAAPSKCKTRYIIKIQAGVYDEYIEIPRKKTNIMLVGDDRSTTIITGNKSVAGGTTTTKSATVAAVGDGFLAKDITFQNTAGPSGHQAVALRVGSDLSAFYRCAMIGYQDTLYVRCNRQFYVNCHVVGTVDFIFGNAVAVFQFCDIQARLPGPGQRNMITAQGRCDPNQNTGIVIQKCKIGATSDLKPVQANFSTYLGRPWKEYSRTVVMKSLIDEVIDPEGWSPWDGDFALETLYYREYWNWGPGSDTSKRVEWKGWGVIKDLGEATQFTSATFINAWSWLLSTGFPFWPGL